jgi:acyl-CoA reductase-like NAD-dependent aldehyde dehydrogenase
VVLEGTVSKATAFASYVDGEWVGSQDIHDLVDPATGKAFGTVCNADIEITRRAIGAARRAFDDERWSGLKPAVRRGMLAEVASELSRRIDQIADLERRSAGIPIRLAGSVHVGMAAAQLSQFSEAAERSFTEPLLGNDPPLTSMNMIVREPIGVCAGIVPWNAPLCMAVWKIGPALAMGNTVVLKPAPNTPASALELARIVDESDLPKGVLNVVAGGADVGHELATNPQVDKISFTGSTSVGRQILQAAAPTVKRTSLELGGKSANIVLDDADVELAVDGALFAFMLGSGEACVAGSRLLVPASMHDDFVGAMLRRLGGVTLGPTDHPRTDVGPLISAAHRDAVHRYVELGQDEGAKVVAGGGIPADLTEGYYYEPTVLVDARNDMRVCQEEIFGPVVTVISYSDDDEAVAIANDSAYGLAGGVWTTDVGRGIELARRIRSGTVWVNDYHAVSAHAPFGGYGQSGLGRELGTEGLLSYTETKHIHVGLAPRHQRPFGLVLPPA